MKKYLILVAVSLFMSSCFSLKTLHSTTFIKGNDAFILGNNEHGKFNAHVTNISANDITIWQCPISGGKHSPLVLKSLSNAKIYVTENTALRFENSSTENATILLKVKGDLGLYMGYSN